MLKSNNCCHPSVFSFYDHRGVTALWSVKTGNKRPTMFSLWQINEAYRTWLREKVLLFVLQSSAEQEVAELRSHSNTAAEPNRVCPLQTKPVKHHRSSSAHCYKYPTHLFWIKDALNLLHKAEEESHTGVTSWLFFSFFDLENSTTLIS